MALASSSSAVRAQKGQRTVEEGVWVASPLLNDAITWIQGCAVAALPALLIGPGGNGKTRLVREAAKRMDATVYEVSLSGGMTEERLVGYQTLSSEGRPVFVPNAFVRSMKEGGWLILNEINAATPEVMLALHDPIESRSIVLYDDKGRCVEAHRDWRVFATANIGVQYTGIKNMNAALWSRFAILRIPPIPVDQILQVCRGTGLSAATMLVIERAARWVAKVQEESAASMNVTDTFGSLRRFLEFGRLLDVGVSAASAANMTLLGDIKTDKDLRAAQGVLMTVGIPDLPVDEIWRQVEQEERERASALARQEEQIGEAGELDSMLQQIAEDNYDDLDDVDI